MSPSGSRAGELRLLRLDEPTSHSVSNYKLNLSDTYLNICLVYSTLPFQILSLFLPYCVSRNRKKMYECEYNTVKGV